MSDDEIHDTSRVDKFMAARRRSMLMHAMWKPALAGAAGAALVMGCVWIVLPKISYREIEVPRVTYSPVDVPQITTRPIKIPVPNVIVHNVPIEIPRIVEPTPLARSPAEERFTSSEGWRDAVIRGRILRPDHNGFVLMTDSGEQSFYPAKIGADGKPELDPSTEDIVAPFIGDLARCNKLPVGTFACVALHEGQEVFIQQTPIFRRGRAAEGPHALAGWINRAG